MKWFQNWGTGRSVLPQSGAEELPAVRFFPSGFGVHFQLPLNVLGLQCFASLCTSITGRWHSIASFQATYVLLWIVSPLSLSHCLYNAWYSKHLLSVAGISQETSSRLWRDQVHGYYKVFPSLFIWSEDCQHVQLCDFSRVMAGCFLGLSDSSTPAFRSLRVVSNSAEERWITMRCAATLQTDTVGKKLANICLPAG